MLFLTVTLGRLVYVMLLVAQNLTNGIFHA